MSETCAAGREIEYVVPMHGPAYLRHIDEGTPCEHSPDDPTTGGEGEMTALRIASLRESLAYVLEIIDGDGPTDDPHLRMADIRHHVLGALMEDDSRSPEQAPTSPGGEGRENAARLSTGQTLPGEAGDTARLDWLERFFIAAGYDMGFAFRNREREADDPAIGSTGDCVLVYRADGEWERPQFELLRAAIDAAMQSTTPNGSAPAPPPLRAHDSEEG